MENKQTQKNIRLGKAGGQALIEGIMMNGPMGAAISVRKTDGSIVTVPKKFKHLKNKFKFLDVPILRGIATYIDSMILGYKCLMESAELSGQLELEESQEEMSRLDKWINDHFGPKLLAVISAVAMVLGVALAAGLFVYLPSFIIKTADVYLFKEFLSDYALRPLCEGIIRIAIFIGYLALVSKMKDIKRVFMYHGAEHKTIFCYEAGDELTVENVKKYKRFHPRCGTSFIFIILIISILASSLLAFILKLNPSFKIGSEHILNVAWAWSLMKIMILPLVMGISYEVLRYSGRHDNALIRALTAPGLWMQRLTTKEPDDSMIEVGITALRAVVEGIDAVSDTLVKPEEEAQEKAKEIITENKEDKTENNPSNEPENIGNSDE